MAKKRGFAPITEQEIADKVMEKLVVVGGVRSALSTRSDKKGDRLSDGSFGTEAQAKEEGKPMNLAGNWKTLDSMVKSIVKSIPHTAMKFHESGGQVSNDIVESVVEDVTELVTNPNPDETVENVMADKSLITEVANRAMNFSGVEVKPQEDKGKSDGSAMKFADSAESVQDQIDAGIPVHEKLVVTDDELEERKPMNFSGVEIEDEPEVEKPEGVGDAMNFAKAAQEKEAENKKADKEEDKVAETFIEKDSKPPSSDKISSHPSETPKEDKKESGRKGWKIAENGNFWTIDTKSPHWSTEEGYQEAIDMFGEKPGWVSRPIEKEVEFFDFERNKPSL